MHIPDGTVWTMSTMRRTQARQRAQGWLHGSKRLIRAPQLALSETSPRNCGRAGRDRRDHPAVERRHNAGGRTGRRCPVSTTKHAPCRSMMRAAGPALDRHLIGPDRDLEVRQGHAALQPHARRTARGQHQSARAGRAADARCRSMDKGTGMTMHHLRKRMGSPLRIRVHRSRIRNRYGLASLYLA